MTDKTPNPKPIPYDRVVIRTADDNRLATTLMEQGQREGLSFSNIVPVQRDAEGNPVMNENGQPIAAMPEGFISALLPINKRVQKPALNADGSQQMKDNGDGTFVAVFEDKKMDTTTGLLLLAIPNVFAIAGDTNTSPETVAKAVTFINEACDRALSTKALNAFDKETLDSDKVPAALNEWLESQKVEGLGEDFAGILDAIVSHLKEMDYKAFTPSHVRACMRDAHYAAQNFGTIDPAFWDGVLDMAISQMTALGNNTQTLERWKDERHQRGTEDSVKELTLEGLQAAFNKPAE